MRKNNETKQHTNVVLLFFVTLIVFLMLSPISSVTAHAAKNTVSIGKTGQSVYITFSLEKSSQIDKNSKKNEINTFELNSLYDDYYAYVPFWIVENLKYYDVSSVFGFDKYSHSYLN